jgi:hypothetical protein
MGLNIKGNTHTEAKGDIVRVFILFQNTESRVKTPELCPSSNVNRYFTHHIGLDSRVTQKSSVRNVTSLQI